MRSAKVEEDYNQLFDFILQDQLIASIVPEIRTFLTEKGKLSLADTIVAADAGTIAHPVKKKIDYYTKVGSEGKSQSKLAM